MDSLSAYLSSSSSSSSDEDVILYFNLCLQEKDFSINCNL